MGPGLVARDRKEILRTGTERRFLQDRRPRKRFHIAGKTSRQANRVERRERWMIAEKMVRIDVDLFDDAAQSQLHGAPVVSRGSAPARFPSVHPFAAIRVFVRDEN